MGNFTEEQLAHFNARIGAGSVVTPREYHDSQITIDKHEKTVLSSTYPQKLIPRMSVKHMDGRNKFKFKNFNTGATVYLNVNLPKQSGSETRLYLSAAAGFKPKAGDYWFIYKDRNTGEFIIGCLDENDWTGTGGVGVTSSEPAPNLEDEEDYKYQEQIHSSTPASSQIGEYKREIRSRSVAKDTIKAAANKCEIDPSHETFTAANGETYVEAHHLVPIANQSRLNINLDLCENVIALCPTCHRAVHSAMKKIRLKHLKTLYNSRVSRLKSVGIDITIDELAEIYNCI